MCRKISQLLQYSCLEIDNRPTLVFNIVDEVRKLLLKNVTSSATASTGSGNKLWLIWLELDMVTTYRLVHNSRSGLKQVTLTSSNERCTIYSEDFPAGSCVTSMNCSHVFHHICIVRWLSKRKLPYMPIYTCVPMDI